MSSGPHWTQGSARIIAAAVLGGAGVLGVGHSLLGSTRSQPVSSAVAQQTRTIEPRPRAEPEPSDAPDSTDLPSVAVRVNINTAAAGELEMLPRIGPVLAGRIIAERREGGPFTSPKDLERVPGIGPRTAERLAPLVEFEPVIADADPPE